MTRELITIEQARKKLGKQGEKMTDREVEKVLNLFRLICNKVIDSVVEKNDKN